MRAIVQNIECIVLLFDSNYVFYFLNYVFLKKFYWKLKFSLDIELKQHCCLVGFVNLSGYSYSQILHSSEQT